MYLYSKIMHTNLCHVKQFMPDWSQWLSGCIEAMLHQFVLTNGSGCKCCVSCCRGVCCAWIQRELPGPGAQVRESDGDRG